MSNWLIPANTKFYDVIGAFNVTDTYWPIQTEDKVFIYLTAPYKQIAYVCEVIETGLELNSIIDKVLPYFKTDTKEGKTTKSFMLLKNTRHLIIEKNSLFSYKNLKSNGLNSMLMGARKLENIPSLLDYIRANVQ